MYLAIAAYIAAYILLQTAPIKFICINNNHAVFVRFTFVHICLHLCRLINPQLAKPYNKLKKSMQQVAITSYQYTKYKYLAKPDIEIKIIHYSL